MTTNKEGVKLVADLKQMKRDRSPVVKGWRDFVTFTKFIISFAFAVLIVACGVYTVSKGLQTTYALAHVGLTVAGIAASVEGLCLLWKTVIKLEN